jgi:hypothetical protein
MDFDHLAEKKYEQKATAWLNLWLSRNPEILSMQLAKKHRPGETISVCLWKSGAFNICYRSDMIMDQMSSFVSLPLEGLFSAGRKSKLKLQQ